MSESVEHSLYVDEIVDYVRVTYPYINSSSYCVESPGFDLPPQLSNNYRPDFYCESEGQIIIGEAKTAHDIDNDHTLGQFDAYVLRCESAITNEELDAHIIYLVSNECQRQAHNILKKRLKEISKMEIDLQVKSPLTLKIAAQASTGLTSTPGIIVRREPPFETKIEAFEYQKKAFETIKDLEYSAIFHEQGLGKTKIAMDLLVYWLKNSIVDTVMVVTKKSLVFNWRKEFEKHTTIKPKILGLSKKDNYFTFNSPARVILTNFETIVSEKVRVAQFIKARPNGVAIIIDESAKIKNANSKMTKVFLELAPGFKRRTIMTGTPVANRPSDIWSQIYFLDQGKSLGVEYKVFEKTVDLSNKLYKDADSQVEFSNNLSMIFDKISAFTVRETKNSGIIKLPPKEYFSIDVDFDYRQKQMYDRVRDTQILEIKKNGQLLIDDSSDLIKRLTRLIEITSNPNIVDPSMDCRPPKLDILVQLVDEIDKRDEKVIVWTMFTENIKLIKNNLKKYSPVVIYGAMTMEERNASVEKFLNDSSVKVLIATNAAKEGLTLTVANNAIFYDRSLSLDDYLQSQDRIHRISQTAVCNIYNLKIRGSIDAWVDSLLAAKHLAAQLAQGDITQDEYDSQIDYSFGEIVQNILNGD